jgi:hypothetical protein
MQRCKILRFRRLCQTNSLNSKRGSSLGVLSEVSPLSGALNSRYNAGHDWWFIVFCVHCVCYAIRFMFVGFELLSAGRLVFEIRVLSKVARDICARDFVHVLPFLF